MKELSLEVDLTSEESKLKFIPLFTSENGLESEVEKVRAFVESFEHDLSTAAGRKKTISLARKVATMKTALDSLGKDLVSDMKSKCKVVDNSRKAMRETMDQIRDMARMPVTEWEEEQERIEAERKAKEEAEKLAAQKELDHEIALLMNEKFDRDAEETARIEEQQRKEQEELKAKQAKEREEQNAKKAEEQARIAAENARNAEIARQAKKAEEERKAQEARKANRANVAKVRKAAKEALMNTGLSEELAKKVVLAIHNNQIPAVSITY